MICVPFLQLHYHAHAAKDKMNHQSKLNNFPQNFRGHSGFLDIIVPKTSHFMGFISGNIAAEFHKSSKEA